MQTLDSNNRQRRPVWAIILGAVRNRDEFDPLYNWTTAMRKRGILDGSVFVSWTGQYSSNPELLRTLEADGHRLLELKEPWFTVQNYGHIFHQMKALFYGLHSCPADAFVLKLRTDKYGSVDDLEQMLAARTLPECDLSNGWPAVFENRIVVRCAAILNPFFINDILYYGRRTDLQKLVNFDLRFLEVFQRMIPEQWFFANPFLRHFPLFEDYYCVQPLLGVGGIPGIYRFVDLLKREPFLMDVMATYHEILSRYFLIGGEAGQPPDTRTISSTQTPLDFASLFHDALPALGIFKHPAGGWPFANRHDWLRLIERGDFCPGELWERYAASRSTILNMHFHNTYVSSPLIQGELGRIHTLIERDICDFPDVQDELHN